LYLPIKLLSKTLFITNYFCEEDSLCG